MQHMENVKCNTGFNVILLSYRYRADTSTIFGIRGLWCLTIDSSRGAPLKYLWDRHKSQKNEMATFLGRTVIISASMLFKKAKLRDSG